MEKWNREVQIAAALETYRTIGGWVERPTDMQAELTGDVSADVVIVGAGFAGLNAALELVKRGVKVVVLEREFAGFGASGRNAGYLAGGSGVKFDLFLKRIGHEQTQKIVDYFNEGVRHAESNFRQYEIDCDYNASGLISAGVHASQEKKVLENIRKASQFGVASEFLDQAKMRERGIPPAFLFGSYVNCGGTLDPGKYVMGLRRAALQAGVKLYENTEVSSWEMGPVVKVRTRRGTASAPHMILASNAYTPQLGLLADKVIPLRVSAIETAPLSPNQLAELGWWKREGIVTVHETMESHRLTARNSLVITTKRVRYPFGSRTPNVPDTAAYRALITALGDRFPQLKNLAIRACWSGYISFASDSLPVVGAAGEEENIFYTAGCSGHGVGAQSLIGRLLAERLGGVEPPLLAGLHHKVPGTAPEPLRWCGINGVMSIMDRIDERVNRKVRAANIGDE
ncbi:NAD(P)/FAD-dependent oxidoreductase [Paraburkholderia pallida]|uniref:FAD-binding oxidoreductase n=1 Tax=Paraburkholderia pallida TaxID=2547399 RepID=A0A4P7D5H8_9BURK|nr:FAD-binding oxidoreductase [Paraburkholderia pallida]QBR03969.1 FAD-binding oxidoreductase [Paraburkholderia pallida]